MKTRLFPGKGVPGARSNVLWAPLTAPHSVLHQRQRRYNHTHLPDEETEAGVEETCSTKQHRGGEWDWQLSLQRQTQPRLTHADTPWGRGRPKPWRAGTWGLRGAGKDNRVMGFLSVWGGQGDVEGGSGGSVSLQGPSSQTHVPQEVASTARFQLPWPRSGLSVATRAPDSCVGRLPERPVRRVPPGPARGLRAPRRVPPLWSHPSPCTPGPTT